MRKRYTFSLALLFLCIILIFIIYPTDEKRIRKIINNCEKAIISEDVDRLMEFISYNYRDDYGNGYLKLKMTLQNAFKYLNDIDIEKNIIKISVKDEIAKAELSVRVLVSPSSKQSESGYDRGYIIGDAGEARAIKVFFEKSPHKWLITKVEGVPIENYKFQITNSKQIANSKFQL